MEFFFYFFFLPSLFSSAANWEREKLELGSTSSAHAWEIESACGLVGHTRAMWVRLPSSSTRG